MGRSQSSGNSQLRGSLYCAPAACQKADQKQHQENDKKDFGDAHRGASNSAEAQDCGDYRNHQKPGDSVFMSSRLALARRDR
jgi:hypothetical protein